jgi:hypothetical protein
MPPKGMQAMRVRGGDQRFFEFLRDRSRAAVGIQETFVKMAALDRIEAIDFSNQPIPD